jgi:hypothetical protein
VDGLSSGAPRLKHIAAVDGGGLVHQLSAEGGRVARDGLGDQPPEADEGVAAGTGA